MAHALLEGAQQVPHSARRVRLVLDVRPGGGLGSAQREAEQGAVEGRCHGVAEPQQRRKLVRELAGQPPASLAKLDFQPRMRCTRARQVGRVRVKCHQVVARHKGRHICEVVDAVEAQAEAAGCCGLLNLRVLPDAGDSCKVAGRKHAVVVAQQRGALPVGHATAQQALRAVVPLIQKESHMPRACIVSILDQLHQDARAVCVGVNDVAQPRRQRLALAKRLRRGARQPKLHCRGALGQQDAAHAAHAGRLCHAVAQQRVGKHHGRVGRAQPRGIVEGHI